MVIAVMSIVVAMVLRPAFERDELEPMRSCLLWVVLPLIAFCAASILLHPVFSIRYCAPAIPVLFLLVGKGLETLVPRPRNLSLAGIATACGVLCFFCQSSRYEPWRDVAARVQSGSAAEVVFFESGLVVNDAGEPETSSAGLDSAFP